MSKIIYKKKPETDIVKRVERLIEQEKKQKRGASRWFWGMSFLLTAMAALGIYHSFYTESGISLWLNKNAPRIKNDMLDPGEGQTGEKSVQQADTLLAQRIHAYNMDFYGPKLKPSRELFLYSYIFFHGRDDNDLTYLNRPFSGDSAISLREWLLPKMTTSSSVVFPLNPRLIALDEEQQALRRELRHYFATPFVPAVNKAIKNYLDTLKIKGTDRFNRLKLVENFLQRHPEYLKTGRRLLGQLTAADQEMNIRLGLFQMRLGADYGAVNNRSLFGWMTSDYKGLKNALSRFSKNRDSASLKKAWRNFKKDYAQNRRFYKKLHFSVYSNLHLLNPLNHSLTIKRIGLFGARRKNNVHGIYRHQGVDLIADAGSNVYPVLDGFVVYAGYQRNGHGNHLKIKHDGGLISTYSHLQNDALWKKQLRRFRQEGPFYVKSGTLIGHVGTTGNIPRNDAQYGYAHLHLEIKVKTHAVNPLTLLRLPYHIQN